MNSFPRRAHNRKPFVPLLLLLLMLAVLAGVARPAQADTPTELFFSEYIEGSSNNKALEIYNGTGAAVDLAAGGYNVQMFFNGNPVSTLTINLNGAVADGDVFVVAHSSANAAILAQADQTNGAGWFNGDDAVVLRKGEVIIDSLGQVGFDPGSQWGADPTSTADNTLRRKADLCAGDPDASNAFDPAVEWDGFAQDTADGLGIHTVNCAAEPPGPSAPAINEFSASTAGADVEYVEIFGTPDTDYSAYAILEIEGDGTGSGVVDEVLPLGTTDAAGFYLANLPANALENGTLSLLLVSNFTGALNDDLDANNDGVLDVTPWDAIVDAVAVNDGTAGDLTYGAPALGPNYDGVSSFAPGGASRIPDGMDTDTATDWMRNDFDLAGIPGFAGTPQVGEAYNTPGAPNEAITATFAAIHDIQGSGGAATPGAFTVEATVVGDYQGGDQLRGFFIQEEDADADADPATSEGIFVFCSGCPVDVSAGDHVRVTGDSSEYYGMSQLTASTASSIVVLSAGNPLPTPALVELPVPGLPGDDLAAANAAINAYFEAFEGMLVTFPDTLSVAEYFELARYGQVVLTEGGREHTFTADNVPSAGGLIAHEIDLAGRTVILDDTNNIQNSPIDGAVDTPYYHPAPGLSTGNFFRGGDTITNLTGVLHWSYAGQSGTDAWRIRPVAEAYSYAFTPVNGRSGMPDVGGSLKVASFNVLNYFLTVDTTSSNNSGPCGPSGTMDCRGADSQAELERQRAKLLTALAAIDADIYGLMEMENTPGVEPLADIVAGLPGYAYIDTGVIGTDAIRVGIIYKTSTVTPAGDYAILDSSVDPRFDDSRNRPALAQTFEEIATGGRFTVVVNHLKSKGSACGPGDDDTTTGQGNCNLTRTLAAQALAGWLATDPTGSGDADVLIIGDLNSYAMEDPIVALESAGYTNLVKQFGGLEAYSYVFDGQLGYLDHALSNPTLTPQVTGVAEWHINADEVPLFDYNDDERTTGEAFFEEESDALPLYEANPFRTSDHDPVIVGLDLIAYEFDGFYPPVENPPAVNVVRAGSAVPIHFSLNGDLGLDVFADAYPQFTFVDCETGTPLADGGQTVAPGNSNLSYKPETDTYTYVWKSDRSWAGACAELAVVLDDGSIHTAYFMFKP